MISPSSNDVVQIETSFHKVHIQTTQTTTVLNYDGSEVTRTVTKHRDGVETVAEVTTFEKSDRILFREFIKNATTGKSSRCYWFRRLLSLSLLLNAFLSIYSL